MKVSVVAWQPKPLASKQFAKADAGAMARYVVAQTADRAYHGTGLRRLAQTIADFGSTARSVHELREEETQRELLTDRVEAMISEIAGRLRDMRKLSPGQVETIDASLGAFRGRFERDRILEQADYLARGDIGSYEAKFGKL